MVSEAPGPPTMRAQYTPPRPRTPTPRPFKAAPRTVPPPRRDTPPTLRLADVDNLDAVRGRLVTALRVASTFGELRTYLVALASEIEDLVAEERAPETLRCVAPALCEDDAQAPSTPTDSRIGKEFGV